MEFLAGQLGRPSGIAGRAVGLLLNRGNRRLIERGVEAVAAAPGNVVADVGFGGGVGLELLLDRVGTKGMVYGVEISETMLAGARRRYADEPRVRLFEATMDRLPFDDAALDGIVTTNTIYFLDDLAAAFAELARVLAPTGRLVIGIGDPAMMAEMPFTRTGFELRPVDDVIAALGAAGLTLVDHPRVGEGDKAFHLLVAEHRVTEPRQA